MPRQLNPSDLLLTTIDKKTYAYIKPDIGGFRANRVIEDFEFSGLGKGGRLFINSGDVYVEKAEVSRAKIGMRIANDADVRLYDYQFRDTQSNDGKYMVGIRVDTSHTGSAELLRLHGNGMDDPGRPSRNSINTDFISVNNNKGNAGSVYLRDLTIENFADSGIDVKNDIYIMNATIESTYRALKLYPGSTVTIVNSEIKSGPTGQQIQLFGPDAKVFYYNTTWDGKSSHDPDAVGMAWVTPRERERIPETNVVELDSNPLPRIDDFFTVDDARYFAQVRVDNGRWIDLDLPNNGLLGSHSGDTLIRMPDLGRGDYQLRAWTVEDGKRSATVTTGEWTVGRNGVESSPDDRDGQIDGSTRGRSDTDDGTTDRPVRNTDGNATVDERDADPSPDGAGLVLRGGSGNQRLVTGRGDDTITTGWGHDEIVFDTRGDIGDDEIRDFNRSRDVLLFTEFVDLGRDGVHRLNGRGEFDLDDRDLDANGGSIALGSNLARRFIHFEGETDDGYFEYAIWNSSWEALGL